MRLPQRRRGASRRSAADGIDRWRKPGLAARIRARLATVFGPEWAERLALLRGIGRRGDATGAIYGDTDALLHANGWLA